MYSTEMPTVASSIAPATTQPPQKLDGCKHYQLLSDATRTVTYNDGSNKKCDDKLYGWYRFTGDAGNRILDYCPRTANTSANQTYICGSEMQGWIPSGSMPSIYQGEVSRMVCFSGYGSCSCQNSTQVRVRNCGRFYVYWLDSVPECNQRYCGVKGMSWSVLTAWEEQALPRKFLD